MRAPFLALLLIAAGVAGCAGAPDGAPDATPPPVVLAPEREDTKTFTLETRQSIEWKFRMAEGAAMAYSWTATRPVYFDFHGDYDDGTDEFVSHKESTLASDQDDFTAPFNGRHGWYFANSNPQTITITLHTKGEYEVVGRTGGNAPE